MTEYMLGKNSFYFNANVKKKIPNQTDDPKC